MAWTAAHRCSNFLLPHLGHLNFRFSYWETLRTTENFFLQVKHVNSYWGMPTSHARSATVENTSPRLVQVKRHRCWQLAPHSGSREELHPAAVAFTASAVSSDRQSDAFWYR